MITFWKNVVTILEIKEMRRKELCREVGLTEASLSNYINGSRPTKYETMNAIANFLKIPVADLMNENITDVLQKHIVDKQEDQGLRKAQKELLKAVEGMTDDEITELTNFVRKFKK